MKILAWVCNVTSGTDVWTIPNVIDSELDLELNEPGFFKLSFAGATSDHRTYLVSGNEISINSGNHSLSGIITKVIYSGLGKVLVIEGMDYSYYAKRMMLDSVNTTNEDTAVSSGKRVQFTTQSYATITSTSNILNSTGLTAGTITAHPDTTTTIRFDNNNVLEAIKILAKHAVSGTPALQYDWWITSGKALNITSDRATTNSRTGLHTSLMDGNNCTITKYEVNDDDKAEKVTVLGYGSGAGQVSHTETDTGFVAGDHEKTFNYPQITTDSQAEAMAKSLLSMLLVSPSVIRINVHSYNTDIQLGDTIYVTASDYSIAGNYRVMKVLRKIKGGLEVLEIEVCTSTLKVTMSNLSSFLSQASNTASVIAKITERVMQEVTLDGGYRIGNSTNKSIFDFKMPTVSAAADITEVKLIISRETLNYDVASSVTSGTTGLNSNQGVTAQFHNATTPRYHYLIEPYTGSNLNVFWRLFITYGVATYDALDALDFTIKNYTTPANVMETWHKHPSANGTFWYSIAGIDTNDSGWPVTNSGDGIQVDIVKTGTGTTAYTIYDTTLMVHYVDLTNHSHSVSPGQGVNNVATASKAIVYDIDSTTNQTGATIDAGGVSSAIDVKAQMTSLGSGSNHRVYLYASDATNCNLGAQLKVKYWVDSY